jgi:hypothetical protein
MYRQIADQARQESSEQRQSIAIDPEAKIREGNRRDYIFRYACMQRRWGLSEQQILDASLIFNRDRCDPPLTRDQVAMQVTGAMKKQGGQELNVPPAEEPFEPSPPTPPGRPLIVVESWRQFEQAAGDRIPALVEGIWPEGALGFIAAPPKKGKTWIGSRSRSASRPASRYLGRFHVPKPARPLRRARRPPRRPPRPHRRARPRHRRRPRRRPNRPPPLIYKPRGHQPRRPCLGPAAPPRRRPRRRRRHRRRPPRRRTHQREQQRRVQRAPLNLEPLNKTAAAVALLHHFGKLTEITKERDPGERMTGIGAMFGALDVGIFITGSDDGARKLRLEFEIRDLATPDTSASTSTEKARRQRRLHLHRHRHLRHSPARTPPRARRRLHSQPRKARQIRRQTAPRRAASVVRKSNRSA